MSKKLILILVFGFFFLGFNLARASVIINEVKYSPTTKQWIEIYNDTDNDIDITTYKILDSSVKNGHDILAFGAGSNLIPKHGFGVIAKVPDDFGSVSFPLFKSSLNIKVSSDEVILKNNLGENISSVDIDGSAVDGNSLQLINSEWKAATPTPGVVNQSSSSDSNNNENLDSTSSTSTTSSNEGGGSVSAMTTSTETKNKTIIQKTKVQITTKSLLAYVGIPFAFSGIALGTHGEQLFSGKYFWNFGDGDSRENQVVNVDKFFHTYFYPGEYTVLLEYYSNNFVDIPEATEKITIRVIAPEISIASVGNEKDFFIELFNNTDYNADLSNWFLISDYRSFMIPRNTILAAKKKLIISPQITHFSIVDKNTLKLMNPQREIAFSFGFSQVISSSSTPPNPTLSKERAPGEVYSETKIPIENLPALALQNNTEDLNSSQAIPVARMGIIIPVSILFVGAGAGGVYFIRRKKVIPQLGSDFEILDE